MLRHAQRIVAQRCLDGVDKNPLAVDLAKLSLWLATFAKDHPFTFLDHALKTGDPLVGLSRDQIACLHWKPSKQMPLIRDLVEERVTAARELRLRIAAMAKSDDTKELQEGGVLREVTGRKRDQVFVATEILRFIGGRNQVSSGSRRSRK